MRLPLALPSSTGHAKILVGLENASFVANKIIEKKLSVRQAESFVQLFKNKKQKFKNTKDTNILSLELSVSNKIGLNVDIQNNKLSKLLILPTDLIDLEVFSKKDGFLTNFFFFCWPLNPNQNHNFEVL